MITPTPEPVRIVECYDDGADARHYRFEPLTPSPSSTPQPGQFFLLSVPGHGEAPFTYVAPPDAAGHFTALVRAVGSLTRALADLPPGAVLGARGPLGHGWPLGELYGRCVLLVAGGCGLAPLAALVDHLIEAHDGTRLVLIVGARDVASQVLGRERVRWREAITLIETLDQPTPGHVSGTPTQHLDTALTALGGVPDALLTCGPEVMMNAVAEACVARGLPPERIWLSLERRMHCGVGLCGHCYIGPTYACTDGPTYRWDTLTTLRARSPRREQLPQDIRHC